MVADLRRDFGAGHGTVVAIVRHRRRIAAAARPARRGAVCASAAVPAIKRGRSNQIIASWDSSSTKSGGEVSVANLYRA